MKVDFGYDTKKVGFIKKDTLHVVTVKTELSSDEEKAILDEWKPKTSILTFNFPTRTGMDLDFNYKISDVISGKYSHEFVSKSDAERFKSMVLERLKMLKDHIESHAAPNVSGSYEL